MTIDGNFSTILANNSIDSTNSSLFINDTTTTTKAMDTISTNESLFGYLSFFAVSFFVTVFSIYVRWYCDQMRNDQMMTYRQGLPVIDDTTYQPQRQPTKVDPEKYLDIESSLINMFVLEHDDTICSHHQAEKIESSVDHGNHSAPLYESVVDQEKRDEEIPAIRERQDADTDEDDEGTNHHSNIVCSICLDKFRVNDIVSISPKQFSVTSLSSSSSSSCCHHVFHHACIKEWLLDHTTCPSCRQEFFDNHKDSDIEQNNTSSQDDDDEDINSKITIASSDDTTSSSRPPNHDSHRFYCIQHGMMIVPTTTTTTGHITIPNAPKKEELMLLRLTNQTKSMHDDHDESNATTATMSVSYDDEEYDATFHEMYRAHRRLNV